MKLITWINEMNKDDLGSDYYTFDGVPTVTRPLKQSKKPKFKLQSSRDCPSLA